MIRSVAYRAVVQNNDTVKHKYPLTVINASTTESYPFQNPTCDLEVISNTTRGTAAYIPPIKSDDYIRLQVSTKMKPSKWTVWQDLFVGQIQTSSSTYSSKNTLNLHCVGFLDEFNWTAIKETKEWATSNTDCQTIFEYLLSTKGYKRNITYDSNYCLSGATIPDAFSVSNNQTYMIETINSFEEGSGFTYRASAVPTFDSDDNIDTVYLSWKPIPTANSTNATGKYSVVEGSSRYLSSEFSSSIEELRNRDIVIGSSTGTITGSSTDATSIAKYGERTRVDTLNWITTNAQAGKKAEKIVGYAKEKTIYGTATLILTPSAHPGDIVYCRSPSQEIEGDTIETYLPVYRVRHDIPANTTTLDLGRQNRDAYDYIGMINKEVINIKCNLAKG